MTQPFNTGQEELVLIMNEIIVRDRLLLLFIHVGCRCVVVILHVIRDVVGQEQSGH